ncbi:recombinase family protein [Pantoea ananatis]|uniref:recombinase family protein n=1 Tax=Pantoea ananas TaxID=553 RepID=UPI0004962696|nr:recombinase family protein [Pantoea ananatis]
MNTLIYARASTAGQDSSRALPSLREFAAARGWHVGGEYVENDSGAKLARPELDKLLSESKAGDVLLVESIDRLSRLEASQWELLKRSIQDKGLKLVVVDLPTSWNLLQEDDNPLIAAVMKAVNAMMIDILATMARQDYETRRARQAQGIAKAKEAGMYAGKPKDEEAREMVRELLEKGVKPASIIKASGISRATFYRIKKELGEIYS